MPLRSTAATICERQPTSCGASSSTRSSAASRAGVGGLRVRTRVDAKRSAVVARLGSARGRRCVRRLLLPNGCCRSSSRESDMGWIIMRGLRVSAG